MGSEQNFAIRFLQIQSLQVISNLIMYKADTYQRETFGPLWLFFSFVWDDDILTIKF